MISEHSVMAKKNQAKTKAIYKKLNKLFEESPTIELSAKKRWVIFSDLHMGDGGSTDDFKRNSELFKAALEDYYLKNDHALILNGDVEELQRFQVSKILNKWKEIYDLFNAFNGKGDFFKTIGNHDLELQLMKDLPFNYEHHEALKLKFGKDHLFVFHGHQASKKYQEHNELIGFTLKYFANPLGIKSYSVSHSSQKQYKIEKQVYGFSAFQKVVSIIGHTHRPLFESLHKVDRLKFKIEQLCRDHVIAKSDQKEAIKNEIKAQKKELKTYYRQNKGHSFQSYVYNTLFHIPCVFNSGCVVGKRGMTCLEIENDKIRLVHWFDKNISKKYLKKGYHSERIGDTDFYRMVINEESLHYIFTRIKFLS